MASSKLRRALSAWPIFFLAAVAIAMSLAAGCGDDNCRKSARGTTYCDE